MIHLRKVQQQWSRGKSSWLFYSLLAIVTISIIWSCGKLSDDTSRPSAPTGISGGIPVTGGPKATAGTYSLTLTADRNSIPADATNFSVLSAALSDSSGRSVFGYTVAFSTSGNIGWFYDPTAGLLVSEDQSITEEDGVATTRLYGTQSGEVSVIAAIDLNSDGVVDLMASKVIVLTPAGPATCAGTYCLEIGANPDTVPADMATYAIVYATIHDSSGGTVDGLTVTFESELGYVHNDPTPPSSPSTTATAVTNKNGSVSIYYYGDRAGSAVITASVSPSDLIGTLINTTIIHVTEGPGEPGDNVPGLFIDVAPSFQSLEGDSSTGLADAETVTITVDVWDSSGDEVGPGVRVEFSGNVVGYAETESDGRATLEVEPGSLYIGTHIFEFTACTYGINPDQTQLCSTGSFGVQVLPPEMEIAISALPGSLGLGETGKLVVAVTFLDRPVPNATVNYLSGDAISPTFSTATTDSTGFAEFTYTGVKPGEATALVTVSATVDGQELYGSGEVSVTVEEVTLDVTVSVAPSSVLYNQPGTILVMVIDGDGAPVPGASVSYTIGGLVTPTTGTGLTDGDGLVEFVFTAGTQAGDVTIIVVARKTINSFLAIGTGEGSVTVEEPEPTPTPTP